jgi:hypothetical protein
LGRQTGTIEDCGTPLQRQVTQALDGRHVTSTTDEVNHVTSPVLDALNRVISQTDANKHTTRIRSIHCVSHLRLLLSAR